MPTRRGPLDAARRRLGDDRPRTLRHAAGLRRLRRPDPLVDRRHRWLLAGVDGVHGRALVDAARQRIRDGDTMPGVRWFPGATLNYAEQALAPGSSRPDDIAVVAVSQTRDTIELTWDHLTLGVRRCAAALRQLGVGAGDRVVAYAPNIPETLVALLATASLGAIWSSCAPEFGVRSVIDRFAQIEPVVLVAVDGYRYGANDIDRRDHVADIVAALPTPASRRAHPVSRPAPPSSADARRAGAARLGRTAPRRAGGAVVVHGRSPPTTRCTCCSARARRDCPRRSSTVTAASSPSTSRC